MVIMVYDDVNRTKKGVRVLVKSGTKLYATFTSTDQWSVFSDQYSLPMTSTHNQSPQTGWLFFCGRPLSSWAWPRLALYKYNKDHISASHTEKLAWILNICKQITCNPPIYFFTIVNHKSVNQFITCPGDQETKKSFHNVRPVIWCKHWPWFYVNQIIFEGGFACANLSVLGPYLLTMDFWEVCSSGS